MTLAAWIKKAECHVFTTRAHSAQSDRCKKVFRKINDLEKDVRAFL